MKNENDFIRGVYEKYEEEKRRREKIRRRILNISRGAAVGLCASFAIFTAINLVPLAQSKNDMALEADIAEDAGADFEAYSYTVASNAIGAVDFSVEVEEAAPEAANGTVKNGSQLLYGKLEAAECLTADDSLKKGSDGVVYTACTENGRFIYTLKNDYVREERGNGYELTENGEERARIYVNADADYAVISEESAENGAVFGLTDSGEYIRYEYSGDRLIMILSDQSGESAEAVAATLEYEPF